MEMTTKELIARNRRAFLASVDAYMRWGMSKEEQEQNAREDAEYLALRQLEATVILHQGEALLRGERIEEKQRARDRAFG
jgi:hypothetical protein